MTKSAYAEAGVDYTKIQPFKDEMIKVAKTTSHLPEKRRVFVIPNAHAHGGTWEYRGKEPALFCNTTEGLGNKNWVAEWMYQQTGRSYYSWIGQCTARMATNDVIAQGALPVIYTDEVAAGDSDWFNDAVRATDFARGLRQACLTAGMALVAGESPALKYLVNARPPVKSAPSLSGTVTGIIAPKHRLVTGEKLAPGDHIIGIGSSGPHANGFSLMIEEALKLPDQFLTRLPSGKILGEGMLQPTKCYVQAIEWLLEKRVEIHALLPGTGDGVAKLAFDKRQLTYDITFWPDVPELFKFFQERLGLRRDVENPLKECLKTFNWGVGYYVFVPGHEVERSLEILDNIGYHAWHLGQVKEGKRGTYYNPLQSSPSSYVWLDPPGQ